MTPRRLRGLLGALLLSLLALSTSASSLLARAANAPRASAIGAGGTSSGHHVLLLSIDGLHAVDLARYVRLNPNSAFAQLSNMGLTYTSASASKPSDSFPGLLAMVTGGSPRSTGVFYDNSYDRTLSPPGSNCATKGVNIVYDETIDRDSTKLDAGGGIDPTKLPLDGSKGCTPVFPHSFLKVNTIFEVARDAGLYTAWADQHPSYDIVNGPSGNGVADLYTPEIAATDGTVAGTEAYDDLKVNAILNEVAGKDHTGVNDEPVPDMFGMNFAAVNVAQRLTGDGYLDALGTPSPALQAALDHTDQSLGKILAALNQNDLLSSTTIILTAKHGQAPIDPNTYQKVSVATLLSGVDTSALAQVTADDVALLWLTDSSKTAAVVAALSTKAHEASARIGKILAGDELQLFFNDPTQDARSPDIVVLPDAGVIYTSSTKKIADFGGFSEDDTHVPLIVANPNLTAGTVYSPVETTQIAPTILRLLGLAPGQLQAVKLEGTQALPRLNQFINSW